ncbi:lysine transporter LysE [Methanocella sp. CWC-04]|uniref:Lysine transporter LysE n=1 Tax=Methanooceanicella nereidis TaxID=2052831 RepID=A0AAP2W3Y6_9EURY|nr:LysE family transporter [Methanocella sp. CWC-04]MCD1293655.1 lysine transporter LysE [Methanocella sp. CWC-04]
MFELLAAGFIIGLTHAVPPGPITFEVLRRGVIEGFFSSLKANMGAVAADAIYFTLIVIGIVQLINNPTGKLFMWVSGCALLLFLGIRGIYRVLAGKGNYKVEIRNGNGKGKGNGEMSSFISGFSICITSPFALIWWTGVFASSLAADLFSTGLLELISMFTGIAGACLIWYAIVGMVGSASRKFMDEKAMKIMSLLCALMMIVFAALLFYRGYGTFI